MARQRLFMDPDAILVEYLARGYKIDFMRARNIARRITFDQFGASFDTLSELIGENNADDVVVNGNFLTYRNGSMQDYLSLARECAGRMDEITRNGISLFYTRRGMRNHLSGRLTKQPADCIDCLNLELAKCKILHKGDEQASEYLDSLIGEGAVTVTDNEHWCKSNVKGPRGLNVLKLITYQLALAFEQTSIGKPEYDLNFGQSTLWLAEGTRAKLELLRAASYKLQNGV